jgi:hypothetical protein
MKARKRSVDKKIGIKKDKINNHSIYTGKITKHQFSEISKNKRKRENTYQDYDEIKPNKIRRLNNKNTLIEDLPPVPPSPFHIFCDYMRSDVIDGYSDETTIGYFESQEILEELWKKKKSKKRFLEMSKNLQDKYKEKIKKIEKDNRIKIMIDYMYYNPAIINNDEDDVNKFFNKKKRNKLGEDPRKPKQPASIFLMYTQDVKSDIISKNGKPMDGANIVKTSSLLWKELKESKKKRDIAYLKDLQLRYDEKYQDYKKNLENYEKLKLVEKHQFLAEKNSNKEESDDESQSRTDEEEDEENDEENDEEDEENDEENNEENDEENNEENDEEDEENDEENDEEDEENNEENNEENDEEDEENNEENDEEDEENDEEEDENNKEDDENNEGNEEQSDEDVLDSDDEDEDVVLEIFG